MSVETNLQQEQVIHLDLTNFTQVQVGTSIGSTVRAMQANKTNCAIIVDENNKLAGIFTDRDLLRKIVDEPETWQQGIETVMTPTPITVNSTDAADAALALMDSHHFRNVPVVNSAGTVIGNLTHYSIIKYLADRFPESVYNLPPDPDRVTRKRDGA